MAYDPENSSQYVHDIRMKMVQGIIGNDDSKITTLDLDTREDLRQWLNDLEKTNLAKLKMKSDEGMNDKQVEASKMLATLISQGEVKDIGTGTGGKIQTLELGVTDVKEVPGEMEIGVITGDFNTFMNNMDN